MLPFMLTAYKALHPIKGAALETDIHALGGTEDKADKFLSVFLDGNTSKGKFAQELAELLEGQKLSANAVPQYIRDALTFLGVINSEKSNEPNGEAAGANPASEAD
jgi:hypothetical protein